MKKILFIGLITISLGLTIGCTKDSEKETNSETNSAGWIAPKFSKEIVVKDKTGENSVFLRVTSDNEAAFNAYLANELVLNIETDKSVSTKMFTEMTHSNELLDSTVVGEEEDVVVGENRSLVTIEIVSNNFQSNATSYSISTNSTMAAATVNCSDYGYHPLVAYKYVTSSGFLGIRHKNTGCPVAAQFYYSTSSVNDFMRIMTYITWDGNRQIEVLPNIQGWYYRGKFKPTSHRLYLVVSPRVTVGGQIPVSGFNFDIIERIEDFKDNKCYYGYYDGANCSLGEPPAGTTAFIYGQSFYYTPLPGKQCPLAGSYFDGANCHAMKIPAGEKPFIWNNVWYVETQRLYYY